MELFIHQLTRLVRMMPINPVKLPMRDKSTLVVYPAKSCHDGEGSCRDEEHLGQAAHGVDVEDAPEAQPPSFLQTQGKSRRARSSPKRCNPKFMTIKNAKGANSKTHRLMPCITVR